MGRVSVLAWMFVCTVAEEMLPPQQCDKATQGALSFPSIKSRGSSEPSDGPTSMTRGGKKSAEPRQRGCELMQFSIHVFALAYAVVDSSRSTSSPLMNFSLDAGSSEQVNTHFFLDESRLWEEGTYLAMRRLPRWCWDPVYQEDPEGYFDRILSSRYRGSFYNFDHPTRGHKSGCRPDQGSLWTASSNFLFRSIEFDTIHTRLLQHQSSSKSSYDDGILVLERDVPWYKVSAGNLGSSYSPLLDAIDNLNLRVCKISFIEELV